MKILVTGALGFVGLNLVRVLAATPDVAVVGVDARLADDLIWRFLNPVAAQVCLIEIDITDRETLQQVVHDEQCTHIVHGAAMTPSVAQEMANTARVVDVNIGGTVNALHAAATVASVQRLICISSSGVYGLTHQKADGLISEDAPLVLDNLYAITKRSTELLTARFATLHDKPMASVRLGPVYGPMERTTASRERLSTPGALLAAWRGGRTLAVAGGDVIRDWTYSGDIAAGIKAMLAAPAWRHSVYNLSYGRAVSLRQMVEAFAAQGLGVVWRDRAEDADVAMRPSQTRTPMDYSRLLNDTGFHPQTTPEVGVGKVCAMERDLV